MNVLWYRQPATGWDEALPVGNGRLGALVCGRTAHEAILLGEESVWSKELGDRNNYAARQAQAHIRDLMRQGQVEKAQEAGFEALTALPRGHAVLQDAGVLAIDFFTAESAGLTGPGGSDYRAFENCLAYRRELDLETAIASTAFSAESSAPSTAFFARNAVGNSITYTREVFASAVADVLAVHITASAPGSVFFRARLDRGQGATRQYALSDDTIVLEDTHGIPLAVVATVVADGGKVSATGSCLVVESADEVTIYVDVQTAFRKRGYQKKGGQVRGKRDFLAGWCRDRALRNVCFAAGASFTENKRAHIAEYAECLAGADLCLHGDGQNRADVPAEELAALPPGDPRFWELCWKTGRYLLTCGLGRSGSVAPARAGLWQTPGGQSLIELDGGLQLVAQAAFCACADRATGPLFKFLDRACCNGKKTARVMYGAQGWAAHSALDVWGDTAPEGDLLTTACWALGAAATATLVRERYEHTLDKRFLRRYYPLMVNASRFFLDFMAEDDSGERLVVLPSVSPGATYAAPDGTPLSFCMGNDGDARVAEHLFHATLDSARDLGIAQTDVDCSRIKAALAKLEPPVVTASGTIRARQVAVPQQAEPPELYPLYGLFPGRSIHVTRSPLLATAAKETLSRYQPPANERLSAAALRLNLAVSLCDADMATGMLEGLRAAFGANMLTRGGVDVYAHGGILAAMTRMVVQSELVSGAVECRLLPCLPAQWKDGSLTGVSLKGNLRADIQWKDGSLVAAKITARDGAKAMQSVTVCYKGKRYEARLADGALDVMNVLPTTV